MDQAALTHRPREARLDGPDQARGPIGDGEQWIGQAPALEVLEERRAARRVLFRARRQVQQHLPAVLGDPPGAQHGLARQPGVITSPGRTRRLAEQSRTELLDEQ